MPRARGREQNKKKIYIYIIERGRYDTWVSGPNLYTFKELVVEGWGDDQVILLAAVADRCTILARGASSCIPIFLFHVEEHVIDERKAWRGPLLQQQMNMKIWRYEDTERWNGGGME